MPRDSISLSLIFFLSFFTFWKLSKWKAHHSRKNDVFALWLGGGGGSDVRVGKG
jgi:hypothetical protein